MFYHRPSSALADGKLAEVADQVGEMVEWPNSKSTKPRFVRRCLTLYIRYLIGHVFDSEVA